MTKLTPEILLRAYAVGLFPMAERRNDLLAVAHPRGRAAHAQLRQRNNNRLVVVLDRLALQAPQPYRLAPRLLQFPVGTLVHDLIRRRYAITRGT